RLETDVSRPVCSLCRRDVLATWRLTETSRADICRDCIDICVRAYAEADAEMEEHDRERWLSMTAAEHCSFCGRSGDEVGALFVSAGKPTFICRSCVGRAASGRSN